MLSIAEESGVHLEISHLKLMGKPQWGRAKELTELIEAAQNFAMENFPEGYTINHYRCFFESGFFSVFAL